MGVAEEEGEAVDDALFDGSTDGVPLKVGRTVEDALDVATRREPTLQGAVDTPRNSAEATLYADVTAS